MARNKDMKKPIRGRGYVNIDTSVISEFYTPLAPKGCNVLGEIQRAMEENPDSGNNRLGDMPESMGGSE